MVWKEIKKVIKDLSRAGMLLMVEEILHGKDDADHHKLYFFKLASMENPL